MYIEPVEVFLDILGQNVEILFFFSSRPNNDLAPKINWETVTRYPIKILAYIPVSCCLSYPDLIAVEKIEYFPGEST